MLAVATGKEDIIVHPKGERELAVERAGNQGSVVDTFGGTVGCICEGLPSGREESQCAGQSGRARHDPFVGAGWPSPVRAGDGAAVRWGESAIAGDE